MRLGNFEVHLFDASIKPREVDPHHTLKFPGRNKKKLYRRLKQIGANIEKVRPHRDSENYSINVFDPDGNRWELSFARGTRIIVPVVSSVPIVPRFKLDGNFKHLELLERLNNWNRP